MARGEGVKIEEGLQLALAAVGRNRLARGIGVKPQSVGRWRRVPADRVFDVARVTGLDVERLRPDLGPWLRLESSRRALARARERFASGPAKIVTAADPDPKVIDVFELGVVTAALRFAARERGFQTRDLFAAERLGQEAQSARAYGMALAVVAGRVSSTVVAQICGGTRQNVDNCALRYERARDGDDPDDVAGGRVIERGRVRRAKGADDALWAAERRFLEELAG